MAKHGGPALSEGLLCRELMQHCDVTVIVFSQNFDPHFCSSLGLKNIYSVGWTDFAFLLLFKGSRLRRVLENADVFHTNGHWRVRQFLLAMIVSFKGIPYVFHPRGMALIGHRKVYTKKLYNFLFGNRLVRLAKRVVALSEFERKHFASYPVDATKVIVIPNPIPSPTFTKGEDFSLGNCFLYLGRLESRKNLLFLIEAFSIYVRQGGTFDLLLVGPVERRYDEEIHQTIKKCDLSDKVKVLPPVYGESKWSYFSQCRAVVYPAKEEAFGRVAFEAVACGTPPILPKQSGAYDYLQSKLPPASFYEDESLESMADSLTFFEKNKSDLSVAKEWVRTQLDPRAVSQQVLNLYRSILLDKR